MALKHWKRYVCMYMLKSYLFYFNLWLYLIWTSYSHTCFSMITHFKMFIDNLIVVAPCLFKFWLFPLFQHEPELSVQTWIFLFFLDRICSFFLCWSILHFSRKIQECPNKSLFIDHMLKLLFIASHILDDIGFKRCTVENLSSEENYNKCFILVTHEVFVEVSHI